MTVFVDTNVLVYARDGSEPAKQAPAHAWVEHLWRSGAGRLSAQVLAEYYVTTTRKLRPGLAPNEARADIDDLRAWRPVAIDGNLLDAAWSLEDRYSLSFWDALIVAAAREADCGYLLTEDLQDGARYDGVVVVDPFHSPAGSLP